MTRKRKSNVRYLDSRISDRRYFEKHPDRGYRVRPLLPGELDECPAESREAFGPVTHAVVRVTPDGTRARLLLALPDIPGCDWTAEKACILCELKARILGFLQ